VNIWRKKMKIKTQLKLGWACIYICLVLIGVVIGILFSHYYIYRSIKHTGYYEVSHTQRICGVVQEKSYE